MIRIKRRRKVQYIVLVVVLVLISGISCFFTYINISDKRSYEEQIGELVDSVNLTKRTAYLPEYGYTGGAPLDWEGVKAAEIASTLPQSAFATIDDIIGSAALIDLPPGEPITKKMISKVSLEENLREADYTVIRINRNISIYDYVDVRMLYPNGENYIVLAKKQVKDLTEDLLGCHLWVNEEEILLMSSAVVDAYNFTGGILYATKYIEPLIQEASCVTYTPSMQVLDLIERSPNIVEIATEYLSRAVRMEMENRIYESITSGSIKEWAADEILKESPDEEGNGEEQETIAWDENYFFND